MCKWYIYTSLSPSFSTFFFVALPKFSYLFLASYVCSCRWLNKTTFSDSHFTQQTSFSVRSLLILTELLQINNILVCSFFFNVEIMENADQTIELWHFAQQSLVRPRQIYNAWNVYVLYSLWTTAGNVIRLEFLTFKLL